MSLVNARARKNTPMPILRSACIIFCATLLCASMSGAQSQRFPAPLGLNKALTGTMSKDRIEKNAPKDTTRYLLTTVEGQVYQLHGHEKELKRSVGKKVRITGKTVGENVSVDTVERLRE